MLKLGRHALLALLIAAMPLFAWAIGADEPLPDPAQEARAHQISKSLRCLVCQNQSIEDSNASLAKDLRRIVRERIAAGDDDGQVRAYVVARYGDWVLLDPPFKANTFLLWFGPFLLLAAAASGVAIYYRRLRRRNASEGGPAALSAQEAERLKQLLGGKT